MRVRIKICGLQAKDKLTHLVLSTFLERENLATGKSTEKWLTESIHFKSTNTATVRMKISVVYWYYCDSVRYTYFNMYI